MPTFHADVAAAARSVAARRLFLPLCPLGAGSRRVPSQRAPCAPMPPRDLTSLLGLCDAHTPRRSPRSCRPSVPKLPLPPAPSPLVGNSRHLASSVPAHAARRANAPLAPPRHPRDITPRSLRYPSPRHRPRVRRPPAPTPLLLLAPSRRVDAARPAASSAPALAARRVSAPLARPRHHRDITLRALRCPSSCRVPRARRPSAPTPPLPPAPS